jgi:spore germination protein KB
MTSFFLLNTPGYIIGLCLIIVSLYVISKDLPSVFRTSEILFYISIFITIITLVVLLSYVDVTHLLPMLTTKTNALFKSSLIFALYTTVPYITLVSLNNDGSGLIKMYLFNTLITTILILAILGIFGPELTKVLRFPEYIVLKRIKILSFIEKIESLLSITYIFDNVILTILSTYTIKTYLEDFNKGKLSLYIILLITYLYTVIFINGNYINALNNYYLTPYIYLIGLILIIILFIRATKKKPKLQIQRDT